LARLAESKTNRNVNEHRCNQTGAKAPFSEGTKEMGDFVFLFTPEERTALTTGQGVSPAERQHLAELERLNETLGPKPDRERSTDGYGVADGGKL